MTMVETTYEHVVVDADGVPWIEGTNTKVVELVLERQAYGGTPEHLHTQHPALTLGQIYSALAYYEDHKALLSRPAYFWLMHTLDDMTHLLSVAGSTSACGAAPALPGQTSAVSAFSGD